MEKLKYLHAINVHYDSSLRPFVTFATTVHYVRRYTTNIITYIQFAQSIYHRSTVCDHQRSTGMVRHRPSLPVRCPQTPCRPLRLPPVRRRLGPSNVGPTDFLPTTM